MTHAFRGLLAAAVGLLTSMAYAASDFGLPGAYLNFAGGAQVFGMGRAYVALADGANAVAWNPAGLAFLRPNVIGFLHTRTSEEASLDYIGYAQPIYGFGGLGLGYVRLDSGSLPETNEFNQTLGTFRNVEETFMAGYGFTAVPWLSAGGTFKFSQQRMAGISATGWGLDLGFISELRHYLRAGMRFQNVITPALKYETATDKFPRLMTIGLAARLLQDCLILTWDMEKALDVSQGAKWRIGVEGTLWEVAKLRGGFDFSRKAFTFGLGYQWGRSCLDYSFTPIDTRFAQRFGVTYSFGGYPVSIHANPEAFSPLGLKKRTTFNIRVIHTESIYEWVLQIRDQDAKVIFSARGRGKPPEKITWDGRTQYGTVVPAGNYTYEFSITDMDGRTETTPQKIIRVEYGTPIDTLQLITE